MSTVLHCFKHFRETLPLKPWDLVDEIDYFSIYIESTIELHNVILLVTDIPLKLKKISSTKNGFGYILDDESVRAYFRSQDFDKVFDVYKADFYVPLINQKSIFYKLFVNYPIGICEITLFDEKNQENISCVYLNITSSKIDSVEFSTLVSYVESKGSTIWAKYSLLKHKAEGADIEDKLDWQLSFCRNFVSDFSEKYLFLFKIDKIKKLTPVGVVESFSDESTISDASINWLINNLDVLNPTLTYDSNKVILNKRPFIPTEILAERLIENTDIVENQVVHGFFFEIQQFLIDVIAICTNEISRCDHTIFESLIQYYSFSRKLKAAQKCVREVLAIREFLETEIPVQREILDFMHLNKIESKEHYYFVYENLLEWLHYKDANYSLDSTYFKGITRLDQLFERGCLYKLIDLLLDLGYKIDKEEVDGIGEEGKITFKKGSISHDLHFQKLPNQLITTKKGRGNLVPDYILMIDDHHYLIIDAKYKKDKNISKYDYPELVLKYLHGIGPKNGEALTAVGLIVLFPDKTNSVDFYHKDTYSLDGVYPSIPVIGSVGMNFEDKSLGLLSTLEKLLTLKIPS